MKTIAKSILLLLIMLFVFTSCRTYEVMHYNRNELDKMGPTINNYTVYIHAKNITYTVDKPSVSPAGVKGDITPISDPTVTAEIRNPRTHRQLKKHQHDLNIYTKVEVKNNPNNIILKKEDITDFSRITHDISKSTANIGDDVAGVVVLGICVLLWAGIIYSFQGAL